ncbi:disintegrin and metalloproteinase domain-containing protein 10-like [Dendronephthya gigantea]|uniref:disintegrin and metalloproteinase domain-containing protein 10-like n=1 Tax=Dendronephthya gigantea TaxID=151771 RepID=UPI00106B460D|nr:disintegrin and metalloproteinase domain-containing protein 10-like [Dendronephthya gigantea]
MSAFELVSKLLVLAFALVSGERLNDFVSHFEPLNYDRNLLENRHQRVRRSLNEDSTLHLDFKAHGRSFKLRLKRDTTVFAPNLDVDPEFDPNKVYKGHAEGYENSFVHGFVHDGKFEGKVKLSDKLEDEFHIEPSSDHFDTQKEFHSVIYKADDLEYPYPYGNVDLNEKTKRWMEEARQLSEDVLESPKQDGRNRYRRNTPGQVTKLICQIHLRADHLFTEKRAGRSKERALLLMTKHVQAVHDIYKETKFKINGASQLGYGFAIKKMRANDTSDKDKKDNPYGQEYIGVEKFLDIISLETTHKDKQFCLSHVFTYRDFEDGVLGLAWVAEPEGAAGGICETSKKFQGGQIKTLNTGVVTFINYKKQVPSRVSEVTFAHELGHNFGAKHDPSSCSGGSGGNYIMFPKATSGTESNNRKFSECSRDYISDVLQKKSGCFEESGAAICGNQVIEGDEECDCGFKEDCVDDKCCYDADSGINERCRLKTGVKCSPSQGLCCNGTTCEFHNTTLLCEEGDCVNNTYCNGTSAVCPNPLHKPDNETDCNDAKGVCIDGECKGSRCLKFGKKECQCTKTDDQCLLCCKDINGACSPRLGQRYWWAALLIGIGLIIFMAGFIRVCSVATPSSNPNKPPAKTMSLRRRPRANPGYSNQGEPPPAYDIEMQRGGRNQRPHQGRR